MSIKALKLFSLSKKGGAFTLKALLYSGLLATFSITARMPSRILLRSLYKDISGYLIEADEENAISQKGYAATYGEISFEGTQTLIEELKLTKDDVFYDLGCGVGKMVIQIFLETPVKKSAGVEISKTRFDYAKQALNEFKRRIGAPQKRMLAFYQDDLATVDLHDATVIYLASTCFSDSFMATILRKLCTLRKGLRLVTLTPIPSGSSFIFLRSINLRMSWSKSTTAYMYQL